MQYMRALVLALGLTITGTSAAYGQTQWVKCLLDPNCQPKATQQSQGSSSAKDTSRRLSDSLAAVAAATRTAPQPAVDTGKNADKRDTGKTEGVSATQPAGVTRTPTRPRTPSAGSPVSTAAQSVEDHWQTSEACLAATDAPFYYPRIKKSKALGGKEVVVGLPKSACVLMDLPDRLGGRGWVRIEAGRAVVYNSATGKYARLLECNNDIYDVVRMPLAAGLDGRNGERGGIGPEGPQGPMGPPGPPGRDGRDLTAGPRHRLWPWLAAAGIIGGGIATVCIIRDRQNRNCDGSIDRGDKITNININSNHDLIVGAGRLGLLIPIPRRP